MNLLCRIFGHKAIIIRIPMEKGEFVFVGCSRCGNNITLLAVPDDYDALATLLGKGWWGMVHGRKIEV